MRQTARLLLGGVLIMSLFGCSGTRPEGLGIVDERLYPCPSSPNCITSDAADADHQIEPLRFPGDPAEIWAALNIVVAELPRTKILTSDDHYLYAESTSRIFGFVDDVEFHLRPADGLIAVRSASRIGRSDYGVNAKRIETVRSLLQEKNLLR